MSSDPASQRQPRAIRTAIAVLATIALAGLILIGNGLYIKAKADTVPDASSLNNKANHLSLP